MDLPLEPVNGALEVEGWVLMLQSEGEVVIYKYVGPRLGREVSTAVLLGRVFIAIEIVSCRNYVVGNI